MEQLTPERIWQRLPVRGRASNKGSFGTVVAAAGSLRYRGAAALACEGALRGGAGLCFLAAPEPVLQLVLARTPECCALPCRTGAAGCADPADAAAAAAPLAGPRAVLLAGPGLGAGAAALAAALLALPWRGVLLDADALNALAAGELAAPLPPNTVLTPHPGEMARLLRCTPAEIQADRPGAALACARQYGGTVVLKGSGTLIAAPCGGLWQNTTGNPGLARGGSGDLLAGLIAALLAQGLTPADAACCGVWLHGAAADRCAARLGQQCMLPHDLLPDLGALFAEQGR